MTHLDGEFPDIEGSSLLLSDLHADGRDGESLLFVLLALLGLAGLALGPLGLFLVAGEFTLDLDLDGHGAAVGSGFDLGLDLDDQVLLEKGLATDEEDVTAGLLGSVNGSLELDAGSGLVVAVLSLDDGIGKGLESLGLGQVLGGLVGGITDGGLDVELSVGTLGDLDQVLDGVGAASLESLLGLSLQFVQGVEGVLLTQKSNSKDILGGNTVLGSFHGFGLGRRFERAGFAGGGGGRRRAGGARGGLRTGARLLLLLSVTFLVLLALLLLLVLLALLTRADVLEELLTFLGLAGGGAGRGLLLALAFLRLRLRLRLGGLRGGFLRGLEFLGNGNTLGLGGTNEDQGLGLGFINVEDQLALGVADGWGSEPGSVESTAGSVEALEELGPARDGFLLFGEVSLFLQLESQTESFLAEGTFVLVHLLLGVLRGTDEFHLSTLGVRDGVELVGDNAGVGLLVVGDEVDGSAGLALAKLSRGDGQLEASVRSATGNGGEGSLNDKVTLDTSLVFLAGQGGLEGKATVDLPGVDDLEVSLGRVFGAAGVVVLELSADGNEGGHGDTVFKRDTHGSGHGGQVVGKKGGLLVVDLGLVLVLFEVAGQF